jgi:hypothetical protein
MKLGALIEKVRQCHECAEQLPFDPNPVLRVSSPKARIIIIGQAPGLKVHKSSVPWDDASGQRLRKWMGVTPEQFYDETKIAIMPMGFCYPGKGASGDLPPRPECAPLWHDKILKLLPNITVTLLIGQYAQARYLGDRRKPTLTETVAVWRDYIDDGLLPLVHPSPRNGIFHAVSWTDGTGIADLGTLGGSASAATSASSNGSVIVGVSFMPGDTDTHAFRWTQTDGIKDLNTLLSDAGVNMTGITLSNSNAISSNSRFIVADNYLVTYTDATTGPIGGVTTPGAQQESARDLGRRQAATMVESRATSNAILGATRPMTTGNQTFTGAIIGSAAGYAAGQFTDQEHDLTFIGGVAYGAQDYPGLKQSDAPTIALAVRHVLKNPLAPEDKTIQPFVEFGGWATPRETLTIDRTYANGGGFSTGRGSTDATAWSQYGRAGLVWHIDNRNDVSAYFEIGQQSLHFEAYSENLDPSNPFPASVAAGTTSFGVERAGGSWTYQLDAFDVPISMTASGSVARSFNVHSGLRC